MESLDDSEAAWLTSVLSTLAEGMTRNVAALSEYFDLERVWFASKPRPMGSPTAVINAVGATLGQALAAKLGMRWAAVSGATGTELALVADRDGIIVYPLNAVARCWSRDTDVSVAEYFATVVERVRRIRGE